ncbi:hypothetical protein NIES4071_45350 [Calothrix sp. NIES-4071]|nr:hypothetical protein NIES4071_45350 [Calothrix sp. NIES-4071]BAZ58848.1 hypothetical protein NIES4105_45280 [Calothrix sp. NIES-4105]
MSTIKERIAQDLSQVKETGGARTKRIREIVQVAVTDAVNEIKDGSGEIRNIAKDAVTAVIENFKTKGQQAKDEAMAAMEGAIAGVKDSNTKQQTANQTIGEQQILEAVDGALVAVESNQQAPRSRIMSLLLKAFNALRGKLSVSLQKDYVSLKELLANWDGKLTEQYGDRYTQIKQRWETAQTSYNATKTKMSNGEPSPVDEYQTEAEDKAAKAGATVAQTEQVLRKQLKTILQSAAAKL